MSKKEKKMHNALTDDTIIEIPEDEIYTYQIDGLAPPHINKPYSHYTLKKIIFILVIVISIGLSMYFSLYILTTDTFTFAEISDGNYQFTKFSNPGYIEEMTINWVADIEYPENAVNDKNYVTVEDAPDALPAIPIKTKEELISYQKYLLKQDQLAANERAKNLPSFELTYDETKPVTSIKAYALNGDSYVKTIYIGENVLEIDGKAFYSCWALQRIIVDENNPNYCDIDGVLYDKDKTELLCYPCDHDEYLRQKYGYESELFTADITPEYERDVQTYVVPSTVTRLAAMCLNYANLRVIYLPEGLTEIDTLAVFKLHERKNDWETTPSLNNVYTYKADDVADTHFSSEDALGEIYLSLPETVEFIGSDAFSYNQNLQYMFIAASVKEIGHHAFWDTCYKEDGVIKGVAVMNVAVSEEDFATKTVGDNWIPQYDYLLFKKNIDINYSAERAEK